MIGDDWREIFDGGWQTTTTKSRLDALIYRFCNAVTDGVFQKDYVWYVRDNKVTQEFANGYIFAWDDYTERLTLSPYSLPFILYTLNTRFINIQPWKLSLLLSSVFFSGNQQTPVSSRAMY